MPASAANQLFERSGSSVGQNTGLSRRGSRVRAPSAPPAFFEKCKQPSRWNGAVVQLVRIPACHAGGRGFEPRPLRHLLRATGKTEKPPSRWFFCAHVCGHALLLCPNAVLCLNAAFAAFAPLRRLRSGPGRQKPRLHRQHPTRRTLSCPSGTCTVRAAEAQASAPVQARHPSFFCPDNQGVGGTASHNENEGRIATGLEEFKQ